MLIGGLELGGVEILTTAASAASTASKPRLRSLTPSAEKLRVSTLHQQQVKVVANGNESSKDQVRLLIRLEIRFFWNSQIIGHVAPCIHGNLV